MSIDYLWHVPAGDRASDNWRKFRPGDKDLPSTEHQVFLAHGGNVLHTTMYAIDELFVFDDPADAQWFFEEGYRDLLYEDEGAPDHMYLNISGETVARKQSNQFEEQ